MSGFGTNWTNRAGLTMSVDWCRREVVGGSQTGVVDPKPTGFLIKPCSRACRSMFVLARKTLLGYF